MLLLFILVIAAIQPEQLVVLLVPVVTWLATYLVNWIKANVSISGFNGTTLVVIVLPILNALVAYLSSLLIPGLTFIWAFLIGLGGVFINQVIKQISQSNQGTQTAVSSSITTAKK